MIHSNNIEFPVLCLNQRGGIWVRKNNDALTLTTSAGLSNGMYDDMIIVDSVGKAYAVCAATTIGGVGLFGGYNIFLNRRIRIRLDLELHSLTIDDFKSRLLKALERWDGWRSRGDLPTFKKSINNAQDMKSLISLFT